LVELKKRRVEYTEEIWALKMRLGTIERSEQGTNQHTVGIVDRSTMLLGTMRHPFIDGIVEVPLCLG